VLAINVFCWRWYYARPLTASGGAIPADQQGCRVSTADSVARSELVHSPQIVMRAVLLQGWVGVPRWL